MNQSAQVLQELQRRVGSADFNKWQVHRWSYYDYVRYPSAGTTELSFFTNVAGTVDPNSSLAKTLEQTNCPKSSSFGQVYFFLQEIRCHAFILPKARQVSGISTDADYYGGVQVGLQPKYNELLRKGVLTMSIGQKDYFDIERPFIVAPPGFGVNISNIASKAIVQNLMVTQNPSAQNVYGIVPQQMIEPDQNFTVKMLWDTTSPVFTNTVSGSLTPAIDIGVIFDGYVARPAQ